MSVREEERTHVGYVYGCNFESASSLQCLRRLRRRGLSDVRVVSHESLFRVYHNAAKSDSRMVAAICGQTNE